jgi:hypothetical protein
MESKASQPLEIQNAGEKLNPFNLKFFVTDHNPDHEDTGSRETLKMLYADIAKDGVQSVRFDWRWSNVQPTNEEIDQTTSRRYAGAVSLMKETGLDAPTINLSSIPEWAMKLYSTDKEAFFNAYGNYLESVRFNLSGLPDIKVSRFQVLNELNVGSYTPIKDTADIARMCDMARKTFSGHDQGPKISVSILAAELPGVSVIPFLNERLKKIRDHVDIITVDYYPGSWVRPSKEGESRLKSFFERVALPGTEAYKEMFADVALFRTVAEILSSWNKEYEIGETGFPTKDFYWGNERRQRYFYDAFSRSLKHLMADFRKRGINLPSRIGFYEAINEAPRDTRGKILRTTPYPEFDWGMRTETGKRKLILQGNLRNPSKGNSRLSEIIHYLNQPF